MGSRSTVTLTTAFGPRSVRWGELQTLPALCTAMELPKRITQHRRTVSLLSAAALAAVAVRSFVSGHRLRGLLAAGGAVAVGATASTLEPTALEIEPEAEPTESAESAESTETGRLRCSACHDPILPGQSRRPNETNETVHEHCL